VKRYLVLLLITVTAVGQCLAQASSVVIRDVTLIDGFSEKAIQHSTVVFKDGIITAVGAVGEVNVPEKSEVIDGSGKFLLPGLWDSHAHLSYWGDDALDLLIESGITSIRELGGDVDLVESWKQEVESGTRLGPNIIWSGPYLEGANAPDEYRLKVSDESEARLAVNQLIDRGIDFIKIQAVIEAELVTVLVDEAKKRGTFVVGHVPRGLSAAEAANLGLRSIEHLSPYFNLSEEELDETIATFLRNETWLSPALFSIVAPVIARGEIPADNARVQQANAIVLRMHQAGVPILVGANFAYREWPQKPGSGLHGEMHALVAAGLSPMTVLQLATSRAAEFNGAKQRSGSIRVGLAADLLLLYENPLENIESTENVAAVLLAGELVAGTR